MRVDITLPDGRVYGQSEIESAVSHVAQDIANDRDFNSKVSNLIQHEIVIIGNVDVRFMGKVFYFVTMRKYGA